MEPIIQIGETGLDLIHVLAIVAVLGLGAACYKFRELLGQAQTARDETQTDLAHAQEELITQRARAETAELQLAELRGQTADVCGGKFCAVHTSDLERAGSGRRADRRIGHCPRMPKLQPKLRVVERANLGQASELRKIGTVP